MLKTKVGSQKIYYRSDDKFIGQRIALGKYERYETALLLSQIKKDSVCVDVGANIGYYTLLMAQVAKRVYALEPEPKSLLILRKNIEENKLKNVVIVERAASNKEGEFFMKLGRENYGDNRIIGKKDDKNGILINTCTLDKILENEQYISLIKVDVQGHEPEVVEGAKKILKKDKPTLFLEYTPGDYKDKKMINFLQKNYSNIFSINDFASVPWPIERGVKIRGPGYTDLFLKNKISLRDIFYMFKNVDYKKWIKGILNYGKNKTN